MVNTGFRSWAQWLLPGHCFLCNGQTRMLGALCAACERELPRAGAACRQCAAPLPDGAGAGQVCGRCQRRPPPFDAACCAFHYLEPLDRLITALKYGRQLSLAPYLGERLAAALGEHARPLPDLVVPVPLHRSRLRQRGYNQALELARVVTRRLALRLEYRGVVRVRATPPQTELAASERMRNLRNAFRATRDFSDCRIAIVDDVMTSGATAHALARCLKRAGAREVEVWVVARA